MSKGYSAKEIAIALEHKQPSISGRSFHMGTFSTLVGSILPEWVIVYPQLEQAHQRLYSAHYELPNTTPESIRRQRAAVTGMVKALRVLGNVRIQYCEVRTRHGECGGPLKDGKCLQPELHRSTR